MVRFLTLVDVHTKHMIPEDQFVVRVSVYVYPVEFVIFIQSDLLQLQTPSQSIVCLLRRHLARHYFGTSLEVNILVMFTVSFFL